MRSLGKSLILCGTLYVIGNDEIGGIGQLVNANRGEINICVPDKIQEIKDFLDYVYEEDENIRWFIAELYEIIPKKWFIDALNAQCVWLAYYEGQAIGMVVLRECNPWREFRANGIDRMELRSILVAKGTRSRGVGRALFKVLQNRARMKGAKWLTVNAISEAIPFYIKLGFKDARETTDIGFFMEKKIA